MEAETGIKAPDLARVLRVGAPQQRRLIVLDCCFSEGAARDFIGQSGALDQAVAATAVKDLADDQPKRGTLLLCSSPVGEVSIGPPNAARTLFSGAVLDVLRFGAEGKPAALSFADLRDAAYHRMVVDFGANAPRPVLHQVNAAHGDLTRVPAFTNRAWATGLARSFEGMPPKPASTAAQIESDRTAQATLEHSVMAIAVQLEDIDFKPPATPKENQIPRPKAEGTETKIPRQKRAATGQAASTEEGVSADRSIAAPIFERASFARDYVVPKAAVADGEENDRSRLANRRSTPAIWFVIVSSLSALAGLIWLEVSWTRESLSLEATRSMEARSEKELRDILQNETSLPRKEVCERLYRQSIFVVKGQYLIDGPRAVKHTARLENVEKKATSEFERLGCPY
jgi:hypothetical protein